LLIRVHRLSSLCAGRTRFFALTPSPSPTAWERGAARGPVWSAEALASAWAEASLPHSISPSPASRERGTQGVRATRRARLFTLALGKTAPAAEIPYRTVVPLSTPTGWERGIPDKCRLLECAVSGARMLSLPSPLISVFALVFQHAPLPTSPVDGGGVTAPSPPAGRVGVGAMFKSHCKDTYQSSSQSS
jgi:hypothetical protein